jgi:hypothetical protein
MVFVGEKQPNLESAVEDAEIIVVGTAAELEYKEHSTVVVFQVESFLKGDSIDQQTLRIWMSGGPEPRRDFAFESATLTYSVAAPLLLPGDRAVLLLQNHARIGLYVQDFSGHYLVKNGRITPLPGNEFRNELSGLTEGSFVTRLTSLVN